MTEPRLRLVVAGLVGAVAMLAFGVSFHAISTFAVATGAFPRPLGWAAPLLVDSFTLAASLEVLRSGLAGQRAVYPWLLVFGATAASAALNVAHAPDHPAAQAVAGIPPVALLLALELLMRGARHYLRIWGGSNDPGGAAAPLVGQSLQLGSGSNDPGGVAAPDTARDRLRSWLAVNPAASLSTREAAELLGVSRSRAGVLLAQERAASNGHGVRS
jgi:Protein of unknown function (DUF2637)